MKKILYGLVMLSLLAACTPAPAPAEVQVVTVVVEPTALPATEVPPTAVPPAAEPSTEGQWKEVLLPANGMEYMFDKGFSLLGVNFNGDNGCTADQCIHFTKDSIGQVLSFFYFDGQISGIISSADLNKSDGKEPGTHFGYMSAITGIPQSIFDALMAQMGDGKMGNRDVGGWRTIFTVDGDNLVVGVVKIGATRNTSSGNSL